MDIKTKFNIGDAPYYMEDNRVRSEKIQQFSIHIYPGKPPHINYVFIGEEGKSVYRRELDLFTTKEELLATL